MPLEGIRDKVGKVNKENGFQKIIIIIIKN